MRVLKKPHQHALPNDIYHYHHRHLPACMQPYQQPGYTHSNSVVFTRIVTSFSAFLHPVITLSMLGPPIAHRKAHTLGPDVVPPPLWNKQGFPRLKRALNVWRFLKVRKSFRIRIPNVNLVQAPLTGQYLGELNSCL